MCAGAGGGDGGKAGVSYEAGAGGAVELFGSFLAGPVVGFDGELLAEFAEASLFVAGEDAVGKALFHGFAPTLGDDGADAVLIYEGLTGHDGQVVEQRTLVEVGLGGSVDHHSDHLLAAGMVGVVAFLVAAAEEARLLAAVLAVAHSVCPRGWRSRSRGVPGGRLRFLRG